MKRRSRNPADYYGVLLEPIRINTRGDEFPRLLTVEERRKRDRQIKAAVEERERALFSHYQVDFGDWEALAKALASQHVPGFAVVKHHSVRSVDTVWTHSRFYRYVIRRRANWAGSGASFRAVCLKLPGDKDFLKEFPELAQAKGPRLQNLFSRARADRKFYVKWLVHRWCLKRRGGVGESGYMLPLPPAWIPERPLPWGHDESVTDEGVTP